MEAGPKYKQQVMVSKARPDNFRKLQVAPPPSNFMSHRRLGATTPSIVVGVLQAILSRPYRPTTNALLDISTAWRPQQLATCNGRQLFRTRRYMSTETKAHRESFDEMVEAMQRQEFRSQSKLEASRSPKRRTTIPSSSSSRTTTTATFSKRKKIYWPTMPKPKALSMEYNDYVRELARSISENRMNKAITIFKEMEDRGYKPDRTIYTMLINGFCKVSDMTRAIKWFHRMRKNKVDPDVYTYTSLIDGYMRTSDINKAEEMFRRMTFKGIRPTLVTYNVLMHHSVMQLDVETAVSFWGRLLQAGLQPDVYTYAIMIHGLGNDGQIDRAWKVFEAMKEQGIDINDVVLTTLMGMHVKQHDNVTAIKLFQDFFENARKTRQKSPTPHTRNVLLNAILGHNDLLKIESFYNQFLASLDDIDTPTKHILFSGPNVYTYTSFMRAFLRHDALAMVVRVYNDMVSRGIKPTIVTYAVLMLAHAYIPDPDSCCKILQELKKGGFEPNVVHYTIVMRAWAKAGRWDKMKQTYEELKAANLQPNKMTMAVLQWGQGVSGRRRGI